MFSKLVLNIIKNYSKRTTQLYNDYFIAPDKLQIKREIMFNYQVKIADFYNTPNGSFKNQWLTFLIKKSMCFIMRTRNFT